MCFVSNEECDEDSGIVAEYGLNATEKAETQTQDDRHGDRRKGRGHFHFDDRPLDSLREGWVLSNVKDAGFVTYRLDRTKTEIEGLAERLVNTHTAPSLPGLCVQVSYYPVHDPCIYNDNPACER